MKFKKDPLASYSYLFRPNYELMNTVLWWCAGLVLPFLAGGFASRLVLMIFCGLMGLETFFKGLDLNRRHRLLAGRPLEFCCLEELCRHTADHENEMWIGKGFEWETSHTEMAVQISSLDENMLDPPEYHYGFPGLFFKQKTDPSFMGSRWIHGLGDRDDDLYQHLKHIEGHTLIVGTTGAGKTRMFDLLISQAVMRGEAVIIIDPKGDKEMAANAERACAAQGAAERFIMFNPAFAEESVRLNPLANFSRPTEIASRIAALMTDNGGSSATFKAFSWQAVNNIVQGEVICGRKPTLMDINHYLAGGCAELVSEAVREYAQRVDPGFQDAFASWEKRMAGASAEKQAAIMKDFYRKHVAEIAPSPDLEGLLSMFEHDAAHFSKMVSGLLPMMSMLTSGSLGSLLSPNYTDLSDTRRLYDTRQIINGRKVAYIGLDSLTDSMVGSAIGSLILSDLTSVAGDRYNYGTDNRPVNIFVDEAAETINEPMIAMLNKGRGAKFRLFVATQTFADFAARLGSRDKATQVLGNINNVFALRVTDLETQEYITGKMPAVRVRSMSHSSSVNAGSSELLIPGSSGSETLNSEEVPLFPAPLLGKLPNLEYIANLSGGKILKGRIPVLTQDGRDHG